MRVFISSVVCVFFIFSAWLCFFCLLLYGWPFDFFSVRSNRSNVTGYDFIWWHGCIFGSASAANDDDVRCAS